MTSEALPTPKVFVSHASEDKERFVSEFAERLLKNGVDAWLDKWEMLPGDSLVDKIFEEGVKEAKAFIIVLSNHSVEKPWVREELNAAFVSRINKGTKLIPVVIDDCEIPEALKSTLWERIPDLANYDQNFDRIIASIFGISSKPPIGTQPKYIQSFTQTIGGLSNIDSLVLRLSCENSIITNGDFIYPETSFGSESQSYIPEGELLDSLAILDEQGYISLLRTFGSGPTPYRVTTLGFEFYAESAIPDYQDKTVKVISALVNDKLESNESIIQNLNEKAFIVNHILDILDSNGYIKLSRMIGGHSHIYNISPSLKRVLNNG